MTLPMKRDLAEGLAVDALTWLAGNEDLLPVFLGSTGMSASDIRTQAQQPEFLGAVLDFIMMDDRWVQEFCESKTHPFDAPMRARAALPGGDLPHWT